MKKTALEKEWQQFLKRERKYIAQRQKQKEDINVLNSLEQKIPEKLRNTLQNAFFKGFQMVFHYGDSMIQKAIFKEKYENDFKINLYSAEVKKNRKSIKTFYKKANVTNRKNIAVSGLEGVGLGLLGIGVPDIPIFIGMILKSIYQISLDFGFDYTMQEEQIFILKIIEGALQRGDAFSNMDSCLNTWMENPNPTVTEDEFIMQMNDTADILSNALLYAKFIQGLPIVGVVGGVANIGYLHKITCYATLKYYKRFLLNQLKENI